MLLTIIRHDIRILKYQHKLLAMNGALVLGLCLAMATVYLYHTSGAFLFGQENLWLIFVALLGLSSCVEFLGRAILSDMDSGIRAIVLHCGIGPLRYASTKAVVPLCIAALNIVIFGAVTLRLFPFFSIDLSGIGGLVVAFFLDIFFCIAAINLISSFLKPNAKNRPSFLVYIMVVHLPLLVFFNPLNNLLPFCVATTLAAIVAIALYAYEVSKRYQSNIGRIDND